MRAVAALTFEIEMGFLEVHTYKSILDNVDKNLSNQMVSGQTEGPWCSYLLTYFYNALCFAYTLPDGGSIEVLAGGLMIKNNSLCLGVILNSGPWNLGN